MSKITDIVFGGLDHYITSKYGWRTYWSAYYQKYITAFHKGTDYGTNCKNIPMFAIEVGTVYSKGYDKGGAGYWVRIKYPRLNKRIAYFHMDAATSLSVGQIVERGTLVGRCGTTGNSTGIHLHLQIEDLATGETCDPEIFAASYTEPDTAQTATGATRFEVTCGFLNVRAGAGTGFAIKSFNELTANAQKQILQHNKNRRTNCFVKGMQFDALEQANGWARTYSGWVCLTYCKAA